MLAATKGRKEGIQAIKKIIKKKKRGKGERLRKKSRRKTIRKRRQDKIK